MFIIALFDLFLTQQLEQIFTVEVVKEEARKAKIRTYPVYKFANIWMQRRENDHIPIRRSHVSRHVVQVVLVSGLELTYDTENLVFVR